MRFVSSARTGHERAGPHYRHARRERTGRDGETGLLVEPGNGAALARAIASLLDDPARARAIGRAGRARVLEHFTWRRAAERTVEVYREAIDAHEHAAFAAQAMGAERSRMRTRSSEVRRANARSVSQVG